MLEIEELLDKWLADDQHHMMHQCGGPALRKLVSQLPFSTNEYRSVYAGPDSEPITVCPLCNEALNDATVREIEDV